MYLYETTLWIVKLDESSSSPSIFWASASVSAVFTKFMLTTLKFIIYLNWLVSFFTAFTF